MIKFTRALLLTALVTSSATALAAPRIYWTEIVGPDSTVIRSANLDGSDEQNLAGCATACSVNDLAVDVVGQKLYYTRAGSPFNAILRANLDGTGEETFLDVSPQLARGIAVDGELGKIYWASSNAIMRADLDGSDIETVVGGQSGPNGLSIDRFGGNIFWIEAESSLRRASLDGAGVTDIVIGTGSFRATSLDLQDSRVYWLNGESLMRSDLDGGRVETLPTVLDNPLAVVFEPQGRKIYVAEPGMSDSSTFVPGKILEIALSGAIVNEVVSRAVGSPIALAVDSAQQPPIGVPAASSAGLLLLVGLMLSAFAVIHRRRRTI